MKMIDAVRRTMPAFRPPGAGRAGNPRHGKRKEGKALVLVLLVALTALSGALLWLPKRTPGREKAAGEPTSAPNDARATRPRKRTSASWPMYRGGPALRGVAKGELSTPLKLLWTFQTEDRIVSSPAVADGRCFIGSDDHHLYALDKETGKKLWSFAAEDEMESSPAVLGGVVYAGSTDGRLYALDAASGRKRWAFRTQAKIIGAPVPVPAPSGKGTWVLVGSYDNRLYCLNAADGKKVWSYETGSYINGAPAVADGQVVFGGCDGYLYVLRLADGTERKKIEIGAPIAGSPALDGARAFLGHYENAFVCVDLTGGTVRWTYRDRPFPYFSAAALGAERVVFGARDKRLHCAKRDTGKRLWVFATRGRVDSSPVICGGQVVVGSNDGRLYVVSLKDGRETWSYDIGDAISGSPAVADGMVIVGSEDGRVYAFGPRK